MLSVAVLHVNPWVRIAKATAASDSRWITNEFSISRMLTSLSWYAKNEFMAEV
jgi:hypothetical protein